MDNIFSILQQFEQFKRQMQQPGVEPAKILEEKIKSGQVSQEKLQQAISMAKALKTFLGGKL